MSETEVPSMAGVTGLSQWQRVTNTFTAPSKIFEDIKRGNRSWWLPLILVSLVGYLFFAVVATRIGIHQTVENQTHLSAKAEEGMANATPEQREKALAFGSPFPRCCSSPIRPSLSVGIPFCRWSDWHDQLWLRSRAKYGSILAVWLYSLLPVMVIKPLLGCVVIFAGMGQSPSHQELCAHEYRLLFESPGDQRSALRIFDFVGCDSDLESGAAGDRRSGGSGRQAQFGYIAVFGWWAIIVLFGVGIAALLADARDTPLTPRARIPFGFALLALEARS